MPLATRHHVQEGVTHEESESGSVLVVAFAVVGSRTTAHGGLSGQTDPAHRALLGAGGSTDVLARAIGQVAPSFFPQPVVVVNKAGGGGIPGRVDVVKSRPDGYTLLFGWGSGEDLVVPHQRAAALRHLQGLRDRLPDVGPLHRPGGAGQRRPTRRWPTW